MSKKRILKKVLLEKGNKITIEATIMAIVVTAFCIIIGRATNLAECILYLMASFIGGCVGAVLSEFFNEVHADKK